MPGTDESHTVLLDDLAARTGPQRRQVAQLYGPVAETFAGAL